MTAYTITTTRYFDDATYFIAGQGGARTGGDTFVLNGGSLIIDTDVRYCAASSTTIGPIGSVTISTTLGGTFRIDASNTRLIPYDSGTGNVPAMGTTITQGSVTGRLCGVWSAINVAPISSGAAMPATGFIKVCRKAGGNFTSGALSGISANATGADIAGWIEVSADEAAGTTITVPRLGQMIVRGDWFDLGTTTGSRGQLINLPSSGQPLWIPGVWIEDSPASNTYTYWPALNSLTTVSAPVATGPGGWTTANQGTDARSQHVQALPGQIRIGSDGTNNIGRLPVSGCRVRIPNVILTTNTTAARATSTYPTLTLANRMETGTTNGGVVDIEYACGHWYINASQAYSVRLVNSAFSDQLLLSEIASAVIMTDSHVNALANGDFPAFSMTFCYAGGTISNCTFGRAGTITAADYSMVVTDCAGQTFSNCWFYQGTLRTAASQSVSLTRCQNITLTTCLYTAGILLTTCSTINMVDTIYMDRPIGTTLTTLPMVAITLTTRCTSVTIDGFRLFGSIANIHPYNAVISLAQCDSIKIRNIGSATALLSGGSANTMRTGILDAGTNSNCEIKRVYISGTGFIIFNSSVSASNSPANSNTGFLIENLWGETTLAQTNAVLNIIAKGCRWATGTTAQQACYGYHFNDYFTSTTAGVVAIFANEKTAVEPSVSSYSITSGAPTFTSAGTLTMRTTGDQIIWTLPYYVIGHTGFATIAPVMTGVAQQNVLLEFDVDNGSGFSGSYSKLLLVKTTGAGTTGQFTMTMANTTSVATGDSVFGTNVGVGAVVQTINSATQITVSVANAGTVSGNLTFSRLRLGTITSSTTGFKLRVRATATATDATTLIQHIAIPTVTNSSAQQVQYPLVTTAASLVLNGLQTDSEVRIYRTADNVEIAGSESTGTTFSYDYTWAGTDTPVYIRVHHLNYQWLSYDATLGSAGIIIPVVQSIDRQYS